MNFKQDQIQNAIQQALNWNQKEHQKSMDLWQTQRIKYSPKFKSFVDFLSENILKEDK